MAHVYPEGCTFGSTADIRGKKITVMGLGLNGGGEAAARFFLKHGAYVTVTDLKTEKQLRPSVDSLMSDATVDKSRLRLVLGEHNIEDFRSADCVIKNPAVKVEGNEYLAVAHAVESDISVFLALSKAPIIAVTGSKGKSSTVSSLSWGLEQAGFESFSGGNIATSPLSFLDKTDGMSPVVLELSSWQLADLRGRHLLKPKIAIITKIVPDHQNWYGDMESYVADKKLLFADQSKSDFAIFELEKDGYHKECPHPRKDFTCWGDEFASEAPSRVFRCSRTLLPKGVFGAFQRRISGQFYAGYARLPSDLLKMRDKDKEAAEERLLGKLQVPGDHTRGNVLTAALAMRLMGVASEQIENIMAGWKGIPHRLEKCHEWRCPTDGRKVIFYNDSCSTVPESCAAAVGSFSRRVVLIAGGTDKKLDFRPLARCLDPRRPALQLPCEIYLLSGSGTDHLIPLLQQRHIKFEGPFDSLKILLEVLKTCLLSDSAKKVYGEVYSDAFLPVVFSPGAASFEMFTNEFDRGDTFKKLVRDMFKR